MCEVIHLRRRETSTPWGFRMNGGLEFGQPLYIQKVTSHSLAFKVGLRPGDGIVQIGQMSTQGMSHDGAKMEIIRAGNEVDFIIQRNVIPMSPTMTDAASPLSHHTEAPRVEIVEEPTHWRSGPAQNPNVQSRSFKILQQQLASE